MPEPVIKDQRDTGPAESADQYMFSGVKKTGHGPGKLHAPIGQPSPTDQADNPNRTVAQASSRTVWCFNRFLLPGEGAVPVTQSSPAALVVCHHASGAPAVLVPPFPRSQDHVRSGFGVLPQASSTAVWRLADPATEGGTHRRVVHGPTRPPVDKQAGQAAAKRSTVPDR